VYSLADSVTVRTGEIAFSEMLIRIADILQVSLDELVGRVEPQDQPMIRNHDLHDLVRQLDELPDEDQLALIRVMDGLMKKTQINRIVDKRSKPAAGRSRTRVAA